MVTVSEPMAPPDWALLEWHLIDSIAEACRVFYDRYFDEQGYLEWVPRWGALDGADDAAENVVPALAGSITGAGDVLGIRAGTASSVFLLEWGRSPRLGGTTCGGSRTRER